ncbi:MAG TPA: DUF192 domain-containing protein [Bryobacteraceae bacterium]|nr:DUF192 domain-containing protein [Bryobacteraceae bacterium]
MWKHVLAALSVSLLLTGCQNESQVLDEYNTRAVTLPDGTVIRAETMTLEADVMRGMMYRDALPEGRGMIFIHGSPGKYSYWMYQVKVPLDIVWMTPGKRVVEVVANAEPCKTRASDCPRYGGNEDAQIVLELAAGQAAKHGIRPGAVLSF